MVMRMVVICSQTKCVLPKSPWSMSFESDDDGGDDVGGDDGDDLLSTKV